MTLREDRLRVYVDADVLLSGIATDNPSAASHVLLEVSELTLLDLIAAQKVIDECERNLSRLAPEKRSLQDLRDSFRAAVARAVEVVGDPDPPAAIPETHPKDVLHLSCAAQQNCDVLVTYNLDDYPRSYRGVSVVEPGTLVKRMREQIRNLD